MIRKPDQLVTTLTLTGAPDSVDEDQLAAAALAGAAAFLEGHSLATDPRAELEVTSARVKRTVFQGADAPAPE